MKNETLKQIKQWLDDFKRKNEEGDYAYTDGDMADAAEELFKRILKENEGKYPISYLTLQDIDDAGYDTTDVTDEQMECIAGRMDTYYSNGYCNSFMEDLKEAANYVGLTQIDYEQQTLL